MGTIFFVYYDFALGIQKLAILRYTKIGDFNKELKVFIYRPL